MLLGWVQQVIQTAILRVEEERCPLDEKIAAVAAVGKVRLFRGSIARCCPFVQFELTEGGDARRSSGSRTTCLRATRSRSSCPMMLLWVQLPTQEVGRPGHIPLMSDGRALDYIHKEEPPQPRRALRHPPKTIGGSPTWHLQFSDLAYCLVFQFSSLIIFAFAVPPKLQPLHIVSIVCNVHALTK